MIYTAIDTFYLSAEQLQNTPSRKDGIDEAIETMIRMYGCDLIQESGILLKLPQQAMATGQVLFHRFYCKKSFVRFDVKRVAASCIWLASKLEETPRRSRHVLNAFYRMECRRENRPIEHLDAFSKKYVELRTDLFRCERHLLKEMGFICHVEHPHKFISNYLATLETPPELRQEAWNLANDSLRTTLCVRFKSEVVACGVIYAAARRFHVPLPENPPWWEAFDADKTGIDEVCRALAHLYALPKAQYIPLCKEGGSFMMSNWSSWDSPVPKEMLDDAKTTNAAVIPDSKAAIGMLKDSTNESDRCKRRRNSEREMERGRENVIYKKDSGHGERRQKHDASRDRGSSHSSWEKDRHRKQKHAGSI